MFLVLALTLVHSVEPAAPVPIPPLAESAQQIAKRDAELFWYAFEGCNADEVRARLTDDFRMVHDQGGVVTQSGDAFANEIRQQCEARAAGGSNEGYRNRRLLVPGSQTVTPLGNWGVVQRGYHTFHEWRGDKRGWEMVGGARFINLWQWDDQEGVFRMQETISIDHDGANPYPPDLPS